MKRNLLLISIFVILSFLSCGKEPTTLIDQTQHLEMLSYWFGSFDADAGVEIDVDIEVTSGGAVDVLLMDEDGYNDFKAIFEEDTLINAGQTLGVEFYGYHSFNIQAGDEVTFLFNSDLLVDIYLMDSTNFSLYQNGQSFYYYVGYESVNTGSFAYEATTTELLYFVVDNTSLFGSTPTGDATYTITATKPKGTTFTYYSTGSALNVTSKTYTFEIPTTGKYYIVVNNADNIEGGATPQGPVDFHIVITGQ